MILSERMNMFPYFGWTIASYLKKNLKSYEKELRETYYQKSKKMWLSVCPYINYEDYIKIS